MLLVARRIGIVARGHRVGVPPSAVPTLDANLSPSEIPNRPLGALSRTDRFLSHLVPFGHDDEPEIFRYNITSICPIGADVRQ